jgi:DNA-binding response OmpR family regulator
MEEKKKVLVVEDNTHTRYLVKAILESVGMEVVEAEDGKKGFDLLSNQEFKDSLSVIILDILMPNMNGLELLKTLKSNPNNNVPIMMLTTQDMAEDLIQGYQLGADYYIPKPFNRQQLLYGLNMVLDLDIGAKPDEVDVNKTAQ